MTQAQQDDTPSARLERLKRYLEYTPDNLALLSDAIDTAVDAGEAEEANRLVQKALGFHPESPAMRAQAGLVCLQSGDLQGAHDHLAKAVADGITDEAVVYNFAYSQYQLHQFDRALATLSEVGETPELRKPVALLSARCLHNTGQLRSAIEGLRGYLDAHGEDLEVAGLLALVHADNDEAEPALELANKVLEEDALQFDALMARATALMLEGKYDLAQQDFSGCADINPQSGRALSGQAQIAFHGFELDRAENYLRQAVQYMDNHIGTWHILGWTLLLKEDLPGALTAFQTAYDLDRNFGETHGGLASVYALKGESAQAQKHISLAEKLAPNGFGHIYATMVLQNRANKSHEAKALFERLKTTYYPNLGATPGDLLDARIAELEQSPPRMQ